MDRQFGRNSGAERVLLAISAHRTHVSPICWMNAPAACTGPGGHLSNEFAFAVQDVREVVLPPGDDGLNGAEAHACLARAAALGELHQIVNRDAVSPGRCGQLQCSMGAGLNAHAAGGASGNVQVDSGGGFGNVDDLRCSSLLTQVPQRGQSPGLVVARQVEWCGIVGSEQRSPRQRNCGQFNDVSVAKVLLAGARLTDEAGSETLPHGVHMARSHGIVSARGVFDAGHPACQDLSR